MSPLQPALSYIDDVLSEKILTCKPVYNAVRRHVHDLSFGEERGLWFDESAAEKALTFFSFLKHSKGKWAGTPFVLSPWQAFIIYCVFGWKRDDGTRRFRYAYVEVPRKNGKTTFAAGIALYMLIADGEAGAEVYTGATTRDQAKICFTEAQSMIRKSPSLSRHATVLAHNINVMSTASKMEAVSSDYDTLDGLNPHCVILDELHAYKNRGLYDIFDSATGARSQSLIFSITTAGFNKEWFCYQYRKDVLAVLDEVVQDDSLFGIVYTLDEEDDWTDPANWVKANPNYGVSVYEAYLKDKVHQGQIRPAEQVNIKTKNLNIWTNAPKVWIDATKWSACAGEVDLDELSGQICYAGLDLATKEDFNAFILLFPLEDGYFKMACRFWIPEDTIEKRMKEGLADLQKWVDAGLIKATPGNYVDYELILDDILADFGQFELQSIAKDAWNSAWMYQKLNSELDPAYKDGKYVDRVSDFSQTIKNMTSATVYLENLVDEGKLIHDNNPVMNWMMSNVVLEFLGKEVEDTISGKPQQARKPSKAKSQKKIDGPVACVMALGEYLTWNWAEPQQEYKRGDMYA